MKYAVLVLWLLAAWYTNAQDHLEDFALKRSLKQDGLQFNFTVLDDDKRGVRHHKPSKFYYWFKAQHVRSTQGASSGRLLHGVFEAFYPDKQLAQKGSYKKGLKHGEWHYWYQDGSFKRIENWSHGELRGKQQYFDADGSWNHTDIIHDGVKKRSTPDSTVVWKSFHRKIIILKDSLGRKSQVQQFKNNELHGIQKTYVNGKLEQKERYRKGELLVPKNKELESEEESEKESGKVKKLWQKWFSKDEKESNQENKQKKERGKREKKNKSEDAD